MDPSHVGCVRVVHTVKQETLLRTLPHTLYSVQTLFSTGSSYVFSAVVSGPDRSNGYGGIEGGGTMLCSKPQLQIRILLLILNL